MKVNLENQQGVTKKVKVGFSWTTFFFGFIPALIRGDLKWAVIMLILAGAVGAFTIGFGAWIPGIIFSFVYNKVYIKELLEKDYAPASEADKEILVSRGIVSESKPSAV